MGRMRRRRRLEDWEVVKRFLPEGWREAARELGALRRARGVDGAETLLRVLLVHLAEGCSLQETSARVRELGWCQLSAVALFRRLQAAEQWLRWLAERLWAQRVRPVRWGKYRVRAVDATTVRESGRTGSQWRVHYVLGLRDLQCDFFEVSDVHGGETFRRIPVRAGDLVLGDRVYGAPPGVAHVVRAGGAVLVRMSPQILPVFTASGRRLALGPRLASLRVGEVGVWDAYVHRPDEPPIAGRLIAVKRSRHATRAVRKRLLRKAQKNQTVASKAALVAARYFLLWTSAPATELEPNEALRLYRLRWQIELAFKRMKSILGLGQLPKRADPSARAWVHGKLVVALLVERLLDHARAFSPWGYDLETAR
jgi:hypothetical protein